MVVDFHAYFQTQSFLDRLRRRREYPRIERTAEGEVVWSGPGAARRIRPEQTDIARRVEQLADAGIDTQILRLQNVSGVDAFEAAEGRDIARAANEEMSAIARRYPGRFIPYATVHWERVHAAERPLPVRPVEALRRYYLETASGHPAAIRMTAEVTGADRLVFGSDYPSFDFKRALKSVRECGLPPEQIEQILGGNAVGLIT